VKKKAVAAVLCGGRGERLRPLTDFFQKTMIPVGPSRRPLLEYVIRLLAFHGLDDITLLTGYRTSEIRDYFLDGGELGVRISYSEDREGPRGSLNAVANALRSGAIAESEVLLVYYGDVLSELNVSELLQFHLKSGADATLVLSSGYPLPVGVASVRGSRIVKVKEKPTLDLNVMTGCMTLSPRALRLLKKIAGAEKTDLMTHFVPELLSHGQRVMAFYLKGRWHDVGNVTSFEKLNADLRQWKLPYMTAVQDRADLRVPSSR
jgi:mannose-1-phosphate guanylyltransferase